MVKITEELWNKQDQEVRKTICNDYCNVKETDYYTEIMKKIVGSRVSVFDFNVPETTREGYVDFSAYVTETLPSKFSLIPGGQTVIRTDGGKFTSPFGVDYSEGGELRSLRDDSFKVQPMFLFGDDLCVILCKFTRKDETPKPKLKKIINFENTYTTPIQEGSGSASNKSTKKFPEPSNTYSVVTVSMILYTSGSAEQAKEIITDVYKQFDTLPELPAPPDDTIPVNFVYRTRNGLDLYERNVQVSNITLSEFNQDLPDDKIQTELRKDGSGLLIFHGEPGCGKSSYIKYLIGSMRDKNFIVVSQDILIGSMEDFRSLLLTKCNDDSIIIIEDCENLVKSREQVGSSVVISDFLNMTDGIYGDLFRIKFILTFNTEIQKIDSALLRKGRLKCKYKFSKLKGDKLKALAKELGIELKETQITVGLTLADLYNFDSEVGNNETARTPIGFGR